MTAQWSLRRPGQSGLRSRREDPASERRCELGTPLEVDCGTGASSHGQISCERASAVWPAFAKLCEALEPDLCRHIDAQHSRGSPGDVELFCDQG